MAHDLGNDGGQDAEAGESADAPLELVHPSVIFAAVPAVQGSEIFAFDVSVGHATLRPCQSSSSPLYGNITGTPPF